MKFEVRRYGIVITPRCHQDAAYIEDTLGLKKQGDYVLLRRVNAYSLSCLAYLETVPRDAKKV